MFYNQAFLLDIFSCLQYNINTIKSAWGTAPLTAQQPTKTQGANGWTMGYKLRYSTHRYDGFSFLPLCGNIIFKEA